MLPVPGDVRMAVLETARADGSSGEALADYLRAALAATESSWQLTVARVKRHSRQVDKVDN